MLNHIKEYYKKREVTIPDEELKIISSQMVIKTLKKKEYLYKNGETNTCSAYVLKGSLRVFIKDHNKTEFNRFFALEDWWVGEYYQIMNQHPSKTSIQALENTELIVFTRESLEIIFEKCPVYKNHTINFYLKGYASLLEKEEMKKTKPIEDQYLDLLKDKPQIIKRIPLYHIASYFGVKPESLSRVKRKFKS